MFKLEIETDNAAFTDSVDDELARILRELANKIENTATLFDGEGRVRDANGNTVGKWTYEGR